jgi:hypothetical protein
MMRRNFNFVVGDVVVRTDSGGCYPSVLLGKSVKVTRDEHDNHITVDGVDGLWEAKLFTLVSNADATHYTDAELKRLTTLTMRTMKPGECFESDHKPGRVHMAVGQKGSNYLTGVLNGESGLVSRLDEFDVDKLRRRVKSLTDTTEVDPSQDVMVAELRDRITSKGVRNSECTRQTMLARTQMGHVVRVLRARDAGIYNDGLASQYDLKHWTLVITTTGEIQVYRSETLTKV